MCYASHARQLMCEVSTLHTLYTHTHYIDTTQTTVRQTTFETLCKVSYMYMYIESPRGVVHDTVCTTGTFAGVLIWRFDRFL